MLRLYDNQNDNYTKSSQPIKQDKKVVSAQTFKIAKKPELYKGIYNYQKAQEFRQQTSIVFHIHHTRLGKVEGGGFACLGVAYRDVKLNRAYLVNVSRVYRWKALERYD